MTAQRLRELLQPYSAVSEHPAGAERELIALQIDALASGQLLGYLELLLKWNARTNLTAIHEPEEIVQRHFGESLFLARSVRVFLQPDSTVLDFGSGGGFPGIPLQILYPELRVTLAESQGKKAAFLREAVRTLRLSAEVWPDRVEEMQADRRFDLVAMRAVDRWDEALQEAQRRAAETGTLALLSGEDVPGVDPAFKCSSVVLPESERRYLRLCRK